MSVWVYVLAYTSLWAACLGQPAAAPAPGAPVVVSDARELASALANFRLTDIQINGKLSPPS